MLVLPEIIENFVSKEMCDYLNESLSKFAPVDENGYASLFVDPTSVAPENTYFFNSLDELDKDQIIYEFNDFLNDEDLQMVLDEFEQYFYNEFLQYFPENTVANKRELVKLSKDLYRRKGTPASFKFLFRLVYSL